jgi:phosphate transport system permease protein
MIHRPAIGRKMLDWAVKVFSTVAASVGIFFLLWILWEVLSRGAMALTPAFFTHLPTPPGMEGGGLANAIVGTLLIAGLATLLGVPTGLFAGVYLAEFAHHTRFGAIVRFTVNVIMGIPSIIIGLFVYGLMVVTMGGFSGYAGAVALAIIMLPVVARTTEDMLSLAPYSLREAALALGAPRWRVTLGVVFRATRVGLITGVLLAIARVSGETAPLLFTSLNSPFWPETLKGPTANLTVTIFNYAMSPYRDWQQMAWGASLVIMGAVLLLTVVARILLKTRTT